MVLHFARIQQGKDAENVKNNANLINNSNITKPENFNRKLTDSLLKNKNKLILNSINITEDNFLDILQFIENSEIMTSISINNCNISSDQTDQILQKIISNQRFHQTVQHLNLNQNQLSQKCIENIRNLLKCCEKCTNISLSNCGLHNGDLEILSDVMQRKQIDTLYLNSNKFEANFIKNILHIFDTDNENESNKKKIINALSVNGNDIVKSDIETLAHKLKSGTLRIRNLSLDYCKLDDEMIEILFDALISNIYTKSIDLEGNNITDASQKSFENLLRNNKSINSLTVYPGNDIKPEFVTRIHNEMLLRRIPKHDENIDDEI
ncbi:hypothetical protein A3Q56_06358 [Intoshia linei]|uniref:Uncharacterized protein n=1 Tax=Intoshia linei TaxID=1819745 RepID=A0A177AVQ7_9BILA|nr:hypothetical protein A3Q56_06358 [Intoshia linei]